MSDKSRVLHVHYDEEWIKVYCKVVSRTFNPPIAVYDKFSKGWTGDVA